MLSHLPAELTLKVFTNLSLAEIHKLSLASTLYYDFLKQHEETIYRRAAISRDHFLQGCSLSDLKGIYTQPWLSNVAGWREFCRRRAALDKNWDSDGIAVQGMYTAPSYPAPGVGLGIRNMDVDANFIATSGSGLKVTDAATDRLLWSLPSDYVQPGAACALSGPVLVFERSSPPGYEVWCRPITDPHARSVISSARPLQAQLDCTPTVHAADSPWCAVAPRAFIHAKIPSIFRFKYPTMIIYENSPSGDNHLLHIVNIHSGGRQSGPAWNRPAEDIDFNETHVLLAGPGGILHALAFPMDHHGPDEHPSLCHPYTASLVHRSARARHSEAVTIFTTAYTTPPRAVRIVDGDRAFHVETGRAVALDGKHALRPCTMVYPVAPPPGALVPWEPPTMPVFKGVRLSPSGSLVAYTNEKILYILWKMTRIIVLEQGTTRIAFPSAILQVEWRPTGDAIVVHTLQAVYILHLCPPSGDEQEGTIRVLALWYFHDRESDELLRAGANLSVTSSAIYVLRRMPELAQSLFFDTNVAAQRPAVCFIDFTGAEEEEGHEGDGH